MSAHEPSARPRLGLRLGAAAVGALLALGLVEAGLAAAGVGGDEPVKIALVDRRTGDLRYHCYPTDPRGTFRPLPELDPQRWLAVKLLEPSVNVALSETAETPWCVEYEYGSPGVRGPKVARTPAAGVVRIAGVGDSFAFGEGVPFDHTLFPRLARQLGPGFEVLDCAQSGADLALDVRTLDDMVPAYGATRAILVVTLNDVPASAPAEHNPVDLVNVREGALRDGVPPFLRWSRLAGLLGAWRARERLTERTIAAYRDAHDPAANGPHLDEASALFRKLAERTDCRTAVVIHPMLFRLADYPFRAAHAELAARARAAGLPVLDLLPSFEGRRAADLHVHPIDHHPNGTAHAISAQAIAEWLRRDVPGFLAD